VTDALPPFERHEATDRFGKAALRAAHDLTEALADEEGGVPEPVVVRRNGPHRSLDGLAALLDAALAGDEDGAGPGDGTVDRPAGGRR
jgi:hypothetical protein